MKKKRIISKPGLLGMTYHYENGRHMGKSRQGLWSKRTIHYDAEGRQIAVSRPGALSDEVHYDKRSNRYISSYSGPVSKIHISNGRPVGESFPGIFGTTYSCVNSGDEAAQDSAEEEIFDGQDAAENSAWEDGFDEECLDDSRTNVQRKGKQIAKKVIGVLFVIETLLFIIMSILAAKRGKSVAAIIAAMIISAGVAFFCLRPVTNTSHEADDEEQNE